MSSGGGQLQRRARALPAPPTSGGNSRPLLQTPQCFFELSNPSTHRGLGPIYYVSPSIAAQHTKHMSLIAVSRLYSEALANVTTPSLSFPSYNNHSHPAFPAQSSPIGRPHNLTASTISPQSLHPNMRPWDGKPSSAYPSPPCEDAFMTWEPARRPGDWSQSAAL